MSLPVQTGTPKIGLTAWNAMVAFVNGLYAKPTDGIPEADLAPAVQVKLGSGTSGAVVAYANGAWPARPTDAIGPVIWSGPANAGRPAGALAGDLVFLSVT